MHCKYAGYGLLVLVSSRLSPVEFRGSRICQKLMCVSSAISDRSVQIISFSSWRDLSEEGKAVFSDLSTQKVRIRLQGYLSVCRRVSYVSASVHLV